ncbi:MAG: DUF192 domain-containing protein [Blastocatellales bacterium]
MRFYLGATGQLLAEKVVLANTFFTRLRGLIGRRRLAPAEALWLRPCNGVHTWWMHYAIDVIFLDRELRIVKLVENMRPFRLTAPHRAARSVLEMPANSISRAQLKVGDQLEMVREDTIPK